MKNTTHTQYIVASYRRSRKQGSWRWQKRGIESLVAWPAILGKGMPDIRCDCVRESSRREGAMGATSGGNVIEPFTRADAEKIFGPLIPEIGGELGPWITRTRC